MPRRSLAVLGWLAAVFVATLAGVGAIHLVGNSITGTPGGVRSQADVARDLAAATSGTPEPTATPSAAPTTAPASPPPSSEAGRKVFARRGGSVTAHCEGSVLHIDFYTPERGYSGRVEQRPDRPAEVKFEGAGGEYEIKIACQAGEPVETGHDD